MAAKTDESSDSSAADGGQEVSSDPSRKLRILCLHGHRASGKILAQQVAMARWAPILQDIAELVFMDAPWPARGKSRVEKHFAGPYFEWFQLSKDYTEVYGLDRAASHFSDFVGLHGPFDGLLGFSQGGILAPAWMGLRSKGIGPKILNSIDFLIVVGGGRDVGRYFQAGFAETIKCPSLHLIGDADFMKPVGEALALVFEDPVVIRHPFGHVLPRLSASNGQIFRDFLLKQLQSKFQSRNGTHHPFRATSLL